MRVRGRRVALLIAGALPLLAEDDRSALIADNNVNVRVPQPADQEQEEDALALGAAEALHGQSLALLPLNLLQIESDLFEEAGDDNTLNAGVVWRVDGDSSDDNATPAGEGDNEENVLDGTEKEPPDEQEADAASENGDAEAVVKGDGDTAEGGANGIKIVEEKSEGEKEDELKEESEESASPVADETEKTEGATAKEDAEKEEGSLAEEEIETADSESFSNATSQKDSADEAAADDNVNGREGEEAEDTPDTPDDEDISHGEKSDEAQGDDDASTPIGTEKQQLATEPQLDKIDDDEDGSISKIVAVDYASKSAGALVLEKSSNFKGPSNLLNGDRDKYAISPCEEKKFVVLSLSEDILVKQVKLVNYELYSSRVKDFQIQISQTMGNWVDLGSYTASPASGVQTFDLREPAWGRYVKFKFTSHYGDEYYCTLSQIMVHGSTMVQGFHEHLQESNEEEENQQTEESSNEEDQELETVVGESADSPAAERDEEEEGQQEAATEDETLSDSKGSGEEAEVAEGGTEGAESTTDSVDDDLNSASDDDSIDTDDAVDQEANQTGAESSDGEDDKMSSKKTRSSSTTLPAASIGLSSDVFTTIIGRLEPLHLKSMDRLSTMRPPSLPDSNQFNSILEKASDSTKAIKRALTDPAILDNIQLWNEANIEQPFPPEAFGTSAIGPREQTLAEKLAAYLEDSDSEHIEPEEEEDERDAEAHESSVGAETDGSKDEGKDAQMETADASKESPEVEQSSAKTITSNEEAFESLHVNDLALANLLDKLPSIECLKKLDFAAFKEKALASRKGGHGAAGQAAAGNPAEPIFKTLTDQIKVLQSNLSIHDQFAKEAVHCYQRVLLDVVVELQTMRLDHEARLSKLEGDLEETKTVRWIFVLHQIVMGLPNWASLLAATFFTSFVSPNAVTKPLAFVQGFLAKNLSESDHIVLSWTITVCMIILCCVSTVSLCHKLLSAIRYFKKKPELDGAAAPKNDPTEEDSCRFTVENANGQLVSIITKPVVESSGEEANSHSTPEAETRVADEAEESEPDVKGAATRVEAHTGTPVPDSLQDPAPQATNAEAPMDSPVAGVVQYQASVAVLVSDKDGKAAVPGANDATLSVTERAQEVASAADSSTSLDGETRSSAPTQIAEGASSTDAISAATEEIEGSLCHGQTTGTDTSSLPELPTQETDSHTPLPEDTTTTPAAGGITEVVEQGGAEESGALDAGTVAKENRTIVKVPMETPLFEDELRVDAGARTPELESEGAFPDSLTRGPVSPSSVAKVSEFAGGSNGSEVPCFGTDEEKPSSPDTAPEPETRAANMEDDSPSSEPELKRSASF